MKGKKGSWRLRLSCVVTKEVICDDCTELDAFEHPFKFASSELEISMQDWEVEDIKPND